MNQNKVDSTVRLFSQEQVQIATFLGSLLAGSILMVINYERMGQRAKSIQCLILGAISTIILLVFAYSLPNNLGIWVAIASMFLVKKYYGKFQISLFKQHLLNGGKQASWWTAVGIGLLVLVIFIGISSVI